MIKNTFFVLFLLSFISTVAAQQTEEQKVEALIQNSFDDIFSNFDAEKLQDYYTDDFILLEQGELWDMEMVKQYVKSNANRPEKSVRVNRFDFIKTHVSEDRAWTSYWNYAEITRSDGTVVPLKWLESATAVKTSEGWRLDMLHSTRLNDKP
ncbi:DUF4440 domain-containing protein [Algoriphagus namhaensis]